MKALAIRKMDWPPIRLFTWLPPLMKLLSQRLQTLTILNHCENRVQAQIVKHELIAEKTTQVTKGSDIQVTFVSVNICTVHTSDSVQTRLGMWKTCWLINLEIRFFSSILCAHPSWLDGGRSKYELEVDSKKGMGFKQTKDWEVRHTSAKWSLSFHWNQGWIGNCLSPWALRQGLHNQHPYRLVHQSWRAAKD